MPALNELYRKYRNDVAFYVVYIQEAHPVDAWQMDVNVRERVLVSTSKTLKERSEAADSCAVRLGLELPAVIDKPDDAVERAYTGWPDRLYVIGTDGRIVFKSTAGPFGFKPEQLGAALRGYVARHPATNK